MVGPVERLHKANPLKCYVRLCRIDIVAMVVAAVTDSEADCCARRPRADIVSYLQRQAQCHI